MVLIIPTNTTNAAVPFDERIVLSGKPYTLRFQWSNRGQAWFLSIFDDGGTLLVGSIPIRNGAPLLQPYQADANLPPGVMMALAETLPDLDAQRGDLGSRVVLYYVEA